MIEKASKYSHAKKGYFSFLGDYPNMKHKYFTSLNKAKAYEKKILK